MDHTPPTTQARAPSVYGTLGKVVQWGSVDALGGPRPWKFNWIVNFQKGATLLWCLFLMWHFDNWSTAGWVYLGLHGSYGIIWLLKDLVLPDRKFQVKITITAGLICVLAVLGPYWLAPWLLIAKPFEGIEDPSAMRMAICMLVYATGVVVMMVSDAQKHFVLGLKRGLITDGMFAKIRHPNYTGEMMVYGAFAGMVDHWLPWAVLAFVWILVFGSNIAGKEASMSRYPEWAEYKSRTKYLIPWVF